MAQMENAARAETLESDIEYIKTLADEGRNAPFVGSKIGIWWGVLLCITLFIHWMIITGQIDVPLNRIGALWFMFGLIGILGNIAFAKQLRGVPGASAVNNRVSESLWTANVILLSLFGFSLGTSMGMGYNDWSIANIMIPLSFGIYGSTNWVLSKFSSDDWLIWPAIIGYALVPICIYTLNSPHLYLFAIFGVVATILIPDFILLRKEPAKVV